MRSVGEAYREAPERPTDEGIHAVSVGEKTGIRALAVIAPTRPMRPGVPERREFEYRRHGTQSLTASPDAATGRIPAPTVQPTRTEEDFAAHTGRTMATGPEAGRVFAADDLTTHSSATLVLVIAGLCAVPVASLGAKGKGGVRKSVPPRRALLTDAGHRIRFASVPKHTSWLNQVEIGFRVVSRRVLRRGSFTAQADLQKRLSDFVEYSDRAMAKPYKWTYAGRPVNVGRWRARRSHGGAIPPG